MALLFLSDENFNGYITSGLRSQMSIDVVRAQDVGLSGKPDPELLIWSAESGRMPLTHDFRTVPHHAFERVRRGLSMPGVVLVPQSLPPGQVISDIQLLAECSLEEEWERRVLYLPL